MKSYYEIIKDIRYYTPLIPAQGRQGQDDLSSRQTRAK